MRKILVYIPDGMSGVGYWRFYRPFSEMRKQFRGELDFEYRNKMYIDDIYKYDLVVFSRPSDDNALNAMRVCAGAGIPTILDIDDDLINLPKEHPLFWDYYTAKNNLIESFSLANAIWVSTEQLLYVTDSLKKGVIVKNAILPSELPDKPAPFTNKWCWRGGIASQADLYFARDWYDELKTQASEFHFIGYDGMLFLKHGPSYRFKRWERNTEAYMDGIKKGGFNVIWKPLEDNAFNRSKSNIAWIEATMGGGACLTNLQSDGWELAMPMYYLVTQENIENAWEFSAGAIKEHYNLQTENEKRFQVIKALCP